VFIPSDKEDTVNVFLDPATGEVLRAFGNFPPGETGAVMDDGTTMVHDRLNQLLKIYDSQLTLLYTLAAPAHPASNSIIPITDDGTSFYAAGQSGSDIVVQQISTTGTVVNSWSFTGTLPAGIAITQDGTQQLLYFDAIGNGIKRYDLLNDTTMADFLAAGTWSGSYSFSLYNMFVLADDSVLIGIKTSTTTGQVERYDASGTLLNTYPIDSLTEYPGQNNTLDHFSPGATDDTFIAWIQATPDNNTQWTVSILVEIQVSDGTELARSPAMPTFLNGIGPYGFHAGYPATADAVPTPFGSENSCPLLVTRVAIAAAAAATLIIRKAISGDGADATEFPITLTPDGEDAIDVPLQVGDEQSFDLAPGTYAVAEAAVPDGWELLLIEVDNGDDPTAITLADGATVTVTVTNRLAQTTGTLIVEKLLNTLEDDGTLFSILVTGPNDYRNSFTLQGGQSVALEWLEPGTYVVQEIVPAAWAVDIVVDTGDESTAITLAAGAQVTATLTNNTDECECCVATKLDIIQGAAYALGISRVPQVLGEASREATTLEANYDRTRTEILRMHPWAFATKYADAAEAIAGYMDLLGGTDTAAAVSRSADDVREWQYAYRYPIDCLFARRLVEDAGRQFTPIEDEKPWRVGRFLPDGETTPVKVILSNEVDAVLEYTADVECSDDFSDPLFERALIFYLAWLAAPSLIRDAEKPNELFAKYAQAMELARARDMQEQQQEPGGEPDWTRGR
jgi:hypothetical protein